MLICAHIIVQCSRRASTVLKSVMSNYTVSRKPSATTRQRLCATLPPQVINRLRMLHFLNVALLSPFTGGALRAPFNGSSPVLEYGSNTFFGSRAGPLAFLLACITEVALL